MLRYLISIALCAVLIWPVTAEAQSARRAFWYSLLVPGWGHYYAGKPGSGARFLALELGLWGGYFSLLHLGEIRRDHYRAFAAGHAHARPQGKDGQYFDDLGFYGSRLQHNQTTRRADGLNAELYPDTPDYFWEWDREESRQRYRDLRNDSKNARRQALYLTGLVVANHLFAAMHAVRGIAQDQHPGAQTRIEVELVALGTHLGVVLRKSF